MSKPTYSFTTEFPVGAAESDLFGRLKPSALQRFIQDTSTLHTIELRVTREELIEAAGAIWILMRIRFTLERPVLYGETLELTTWPVHSTGATFLREVEIKSNGKTVGNSSSLWVIADVSTHKILRPAAVFEKIGGFPTEDRHFAPPDKFSAPEILTSAEAYRVGYSDTDMNGHVNNVRYADFACNALRFDTMPDLYAKTLQISYLSECIPGEVLGFETGVSDSGLYARGSTDGKANFEALIETAKI